jgi:hypothetical protein
MRIVRNSVVRMNYDEWARWPKDDKGVMLPYIETTAEHFLINIGLPTKKYLEELTNDEKLFFDELQSIVNRVRNDS